ncbi:hypothetical protein EH165_00095 [Nakamurella antarctica]|uniref:Uncharacterized protein n=1 Tax=Nakamurella antarctica TaxID=1902245 RepID=A0A3G8ZHT8_9ACTN|nr:hypothetical protein [Nakamurella antarctica]AZI56808.1 hypothetical protein EH165_00095 [Nakamurella antarctica]
MSKVWRRDRALFLTGRALGIRDPPSASSTDVSSRLTLTTRASTPTSRNCGPQRAGVSEILDAALPYLNESMQAEVPHAGRRLLRSSPHTGCELPYAFQVDISAGSERLGVIRGLLKDANGTEQEIVSYTSSLVANVLLRQQP